MSQLSKLVPTSGPGSGTVTSISAGMGITLTPNPITTTGTVALTIPVSIANGGTNATSFTTTDGTVYYNGTSLVTTTTGTSGQVLTSNGVGFAPSYQNAGSSSITITGDSGGGLTGNSFTFTGGSTGLLFSGSGTTETLTGTLIVGNGGTGTTTLTSHGVLLGNGTSAITATAAGTTGQVLTGVTGSAPTFQSPAASSITITGDSGGGLTGNSFTFTGGTSGLTFAGAGTTETLGGTLKLANGGTNASLTASNGGIFYSTASAGAILSGTATADQVLLSGSSTTPAWSTATYPATTTINQLLYSSANNTIGGVTAGDFGVLISSSSGVPSWLANGTTGQVLTATTSGTPSWASAASGGITTIDGDSGSITGSTVTISGGTTGLTTSGSSATMNITGTLGIANGGTNATSMTTSTGIVKYDGTRLVTSSTAKIDSSNRMTNTSQPCFMAYLNAAVTNVTGDGTSYTIVFNSTLVNQGTNYSTSTGLFTAPVTGNYQFNASVYWTSATGTAGSVTNTYIEVNSVLYQISSLGDSASGNGNQCVSGSIILPMTASQTANVQIIGNLMSPAKTMGVNGNSSGSGGTYFSGYLVC